MLPSYLEQNRRTDLRLSYEGRKFVGIGDFQLPVLVLYSRSQPQRCLLWATATCIHIKELMDCLCANGCQTLFLFLILEILEFLKKVWEVEDFFLHPLWKKWLLLILINENGKLLWSCKPSVYSSCIKWVHLLGPGDVFCVLKSAWAELYTQLDYVKGMSSKTEIGMGTIP